MEKTVSSEKQESMKSELEKSEAIPALLKHYLGVGISAKTSAIGNFVGKIWQSAFDVSSTL